MFQVFVDAHHSFGNVTASNSERPTELTDKATNTATSTFHTDRDSHIITNVSTNADASINTDAAFATYTAYNTNADTPCGLDAPWLPVSRAFSR